MKNMYGVVERPQDLHADGCNPGVADLNAMPAVREKIKLTIGDAMSSVYEGGPGFHPEHLWYPNALLVETIVWRSIRRRGRCLKRSAPKRDCRPSRLRRPPRYIATAADAAHGLGVNEFEADQSVEV